MEIKYGHDLLTAAAAELPGPVVAVTAGELLAEAPGRVLVAGGLGRAELGRLADAAAGARAVIALGPGPVMAAGRYAAWKTGAKLAVAPAPLDSGEFCDPRVGVIESGVRTVVGEKPADLALIDYDLIWSRPEAETRAAAGEVLAVLTAVEDWKRGGEQYDEGVAEQALEIVSEVMDRADEIFDLTEAGVRALAEGMAARERLAAKAGHRRMLEGTEHALADCLEARAGRPLPPGAALALATVLMTAVQGKGPRAAKQFLHWVQAPWKPEDLRLTDGDVAAALAALPAYAPARAFAVVRETQFSGETIARAVAAMREPIIRNSFQERTD